VTAIALHSADSHDLIRVHGARVNNLKDISIEIPKCRLTVFTGVSGSGKSSLVFGTIAAESQRLINETYRAFVQGFMPTLARPEVDVLDGLTTAIIVDQQRMGADARSTVGTATDTGALLRILFSRLGQPHIGSPSAFAFNVPSVRASGGITVERGNRRTVKATYSRTAGMCPRYRAPPRGHGTRRLDHRPRPRRRPRRRPDRVRGHADLVAARSTLTGEHLAAYVGT
jgi:excinuclease UvrABC ATPase subunit